jgi:uncharacterized protein
MNVLLTGATGVVGSALSPFLTEQGHRVVALQRHKPAGEVRGPYWSPVTNEVNLGPAGPIDAVIHLAGENIAQRWSREAKRRIRDSRVEGTRLLVGTILQHNPRPKVFLCASATGFYGDRGDELLDEESAPGKGFLAEVCREWEAATEPASRNGVRVVNLRFGIVLSRRGGALKKMLTPFRLGLGGKLSNGQHYWSWIAIDDAIRAIGFALTTESIIGPVNVVTPNPVRNIDFTKTLAAILHRPAFFKVPKFAIKLLMGEMGEEALLSSFRVKPAKLQAHQFAFRFPGLRPALEHILR